MDVPLAAAAHAPPARDTIDDVYFDDHPFVGSAPATAADIPLLVGCTRTECSYYMRGDARNFALERADVERRVGNFMRVSEARAAAIVERYEAATPGATPSDLLVLACSDYMFKRPT